MAEIKREPDSAKWPRASREQAAVEDTDDRVGALLRQTRERRGLGLDDIAAVLKIRRSHIAAIEESRPEELPGLPYAVGFVRTYAEYLDLDGAEMVRLFKGEVSDVEDRTELVFPAPLKEGRFPGGILVVGSLLLGAAVYGAWYFLSEKETMMAEAPASAPAEVAERPDETGEPPAAADASVQPQTAQAPGGDGMTSGDRQPSTKPGAESGAGENSSPQQASTTGEPSPPSAEAPVVIVDAPPPPSAEVVPPSVKEASSAPSSDMLVDTPPDAPQVAQPATQAPPPAEAAADTPAAVSEPAREVAVAPQPEVPASASGGTESAPPASPTSEPSEAAAPVAKAVIEEPLSPARAPAGESGAQGEAGEQSARSPADGPSSVGPGGPRVELVAVADSWVHIRNAENQTVFARILREGDRYSVPADPGLEMITGNAGALRIFVDGKEVPALGPMGAVRRNVSLDPESLRDR